MTSAEWLSSLSVVAFTIDENEENRRDGRRERQQQAREEVETDRQTDGQTQMLQEREGGGKRGKRR